jgi:hypothetical protein
VTIALSAAPWAHAQSPSGDAAQGTRDAPSAAGIYPQDFGAACNGASDDTFALLAWARAISTRSPGRLGGGDCVFSRPLRLQAIDGGAILGAGAGVSRLIYAGDDPRADILVLSGPDGGQVGHWTFEGFTIDSRTRMIDGAALRLRRVNHIALRDVTTAGQHGSRNLWNGMWFDGVDQVAVDIYESTARNDGVRVNGGTGPNSPNADLYLAKGKISESRVGLHVGGAFGGLMVDMSDIEANDVNLLVDSTLALGENRELTFGPTAAFDAARVGPNVDIDDPRMGTSGVIRFSGTWSASSKTENVRIRAGFKGIFRWEGGDCFNAALDCIRIDSPAAQVLMSNVLIRNNRRYGVNLAVANPYVTVASPFLVGNGSDFGGFPPIRR